MIEHPASDSKPVFASLSNVRTNLQNLRGLRGRMVLYFSLSAFAAAVSLSVVTYATTRSYLLNQRSEVATSQAINNAQLLQTLISSNRTDTGDIVTNIRSESGGYAVLHLSQDDTFFRTRTVALHPIKSAD